MIGIDEERETIAYKVSGWSVANDPMVENESATVRAPIQIS